MSRFLWFTVYMQLAPKRARAQLGRQVTFCAKNRKKSDFTYIRQILQLAVYQCTRKGHQLLACGMGSWLLAAINEPMNTARCREGRTQSTTRRKRLHYHGYSKLQLTRMWANTQRDGRPAEHRWRPLFNAAKFG